MPSGVCGNEDFTLRIVPALLRPTPDFTEAHRMRSKIEEIVDKVEDLPKRAAEYATGAARRAIEATPLSPEEIGPWVGQTVHITFDTLRKRDADPEEILKGITLGVLQGAFQANLDMRETLKHFRIAALEEAKDLPLTPADTLQLVGRVAHQYAQTLPAYSKARLEDAIVSQLFLKALD